MVNTSNEYLKDIRKDRSRPLKINILITKYDIERLITKLPTGDNMLREENTEGCLDAWDLIRTPSRLIECIIELARRRLLDPS
jgi:hypothetical protein